MQVCEHLNALLLKRKEEFTLNIDVRKKVMDVKALLELVKTQWNFEVSSVANQRKNRIATLLNTPTIAFDHYSGY